MCACAKRGERGAARDGGGRRSERASERASTGRGCVSAKPRRFSHTRGEQQLLLRRLPARPPGLTSSLAAAMVRARVVPACAGWRARRARRGRRGASGKRSMPRARRQQRGKARSTRRGEPAPGMLVSGARHSLLAVLARGGDGAAAAVRAARGRAGEAARATGGEAAGEAEVRRRGGRGNTRRRARTSAPRTHPWKRHDSCGGGGAGRRGGEADRRAVRRRMARRTLPSHHPSSRVASFPARHAHLAVLALGARDSHVAAERHCVGCETGGSERRERGACVCVCVVCRASAAAAEPRCLSEPR